MTITWEDVLVDFQVCDAECADAFASIGLDHVRHVGRPEVGALVRCWQGEWKTNPTRMHDCAMYLEPAEEDGEGGTEMEGNLDAGRQRECTGKLKK